MLDFSLTISHRGIADVVHKITDLPFFGLDTFGMLNFLTIIERLGSFFTDRPTTFWLLPMPICLSCLSLFGCEKRSAERPWGVKRGVPLLQDDTSE